MRKQKLPGYLLLLVVLSLMAFACSDDATPFDNGATTDEIADAAEDFSATLADPDEGMLQFWMEDSIPPTSTDIIKDGSNDREIDDTTFTRGDLTITIDRTFYDVDGNESEYYDSLTSVRMTRLLTIQGTRGGERRQAEIDHEGLIDVTGITPDDTIRTLNGSGSRTVTSHFVANWREVERDFEATHTWTRNDIQHHVNRELYPYPLSGSLDVTTEIHNTITRNNETITRDVDVEFTVFFDGTRYARVEVVDGPTYYIDLDEGRAHRTHP